jgi:hypothetical protein
MDLANYYKTMWELKYKHQLSFDEYYNMIPYERDIYIDLTQAHLEELEKNSTN